MAAASAPFPFWRRIGPIGRLFIGTALVLLIGFLGVCYAAPLGVEFFWPYAGIWAAIGWGGSRVSFRPVLALIGIGILVDLSQGAPLGCWAAIHLVAYLVSSVFRTRALTDPSGMIRLLGDVTAFVTAFIFARWVIGAYLGGMSTQAILGSFLTTGLLYFPMRSYFQLRQDERVSG